VAHRRAAGLTQEEVATAAGLSVSLIRKLEKAQKTPTRRTLARLSQTVLRLDQATRPPAQRPIRFWELQVLRSLIGGAQLLPEIPGENAELRRALYDLITLGLVEADEVGPASLRCRLQSAEKLSDVARDYLQLVRDAIAGEAEGARQQRLRRLLLKEPAA